MTDHSALISALVSGTTLLIVVVRLIVGTRRADLEKIGDQIRKIHENFGNFESRVLVLEQWRISVEERLSKSEQFREQIAESLRQIIEQIAELRGEQAATRKKRF